MKNFTIEEKRIWSICEACRIAIIDEDFRRFEDNQPPLTKLQQLIIYQRYQDMVVLKYPSERWEEIGNTFDRVFKAVEEYHKNDNLAYY